MMLITMILTLSSALTSSHKPGGLLVDYKMQGVITGSVLLILMILALIVNDLMIACKFC